VVHIRRLESIEVTLVLRKLLDNFHVHGETLPIDTFGSQAGWNGMKGNKQRVAEHRKKKQPKLVNCHQFFFLPFSFLPLFTACSLCRHVAIRCSTSFPKGDQRIQWYHLVHVEGLSRVGFRVHSVFSWQGHLLVFL